MFSVAGINAVNAAAGWQTAEFNVSGAGGSSAGGGQLNFNAGSSMVPRTRIFYGGTAAPTCVAQGFTGETNNLSFGPSAPASSGPGPAVFIEESIAGGAVSNCAAATSIGDTHIATVNGLFYDFQSSGDYVLAEIGSDFQVQTRQVSGAPTWPNTSVNNAVAVRAGKTKIAICLAPNRVFVDGKDAELGDANTIAVAENVYLRRMGNVYTVIGQNGDSVRAELKSKYINVTVGLGRWPVDVRGLIANADNNVRLIATRDGVVLSNTFAFEDLYQRFGESWRVHEKESLLSSC